LNKKNILVFVPMYNCEEQIVRVLKQFDESILSYIDQIVLINNRSTDDTESVAISYIEKHKELPVAILRNDDNYGLGGSHKVAFNYALTNKFDYIIVLHGDDQANIADLTNILQQKQYEKYDACLGARFHKDSKLIGYSDFRAWGNKVYNFLFSIVCLSRVYDLGSGLNVYKIETLRNKYYKKFPDDLTFNYIMIMAAYYYKQNIMFFPISWREEDQTSNVKLMTQAMKVLKMLIKFMLNRKRFIKCELRNKLIKNYTAKKIN
jgi:glycosyltransferase involved in cell wall biosynthesis